MSHATPKTSTAGRPARPARGWPLAAALAAALCAGSAHADITVIVNAANGAALDEETIASIFLGQTRSFPGGADAVPVNQKDATPAGQEFATRYLKKTTPQLRAYWAKQVFTGGSRPPKDLESDEAVMKFVAATPGGIGYVETTKLMAGVRAARR